MTHNELQRFNKKAVWDGQCFVWIRGFRNGYGVLGVKRDGKHVVEYAHRLAYEHYIGPIPEGLTLDHSCRYPNGRSKRACVTPTHTEPVPLGVNVLRGETLCGINSRKTHCPKGHAYEGENLILARRGDGRIIRQCRECHREFDRQPKRRLRRR